MVFNTNKDKGNAGLAMAIAYFGSNGYTVSIPLNDTQDYDLIIEKDNSFKTVQCKATNYIPKGSQNYQLLLASSGGTKGTVYKTVKDTKVDLLFALCGDGTMYLIPVEEINNSKSINLIKEKSKFTNSDCIDTSKYIITF
jgi:hypothetical protein